MRHACSIALMLAYIAASPADAADSGFGRLYGGRSADVPQSIWLRDRDGTARHLQSELQCLPSPGSFRLTQIVAIDPFGFDVGCQYDDTRRNRITLYLTKISPPMLADYFTASAGELEKNAPNAVRLSAESAKSFTSDSAWLMALYNINGGRGRTGLWVSDFSGWAVTFRATYAPADEQAAFDAMTAIAAAGARTAGAHLAACAATPVPERKGERVTEPDALMYSIGTLGIAGHVAKSDKPLPPAVWCGEKAYPDRATPMLLWRNIGEKSASTAVGRFTLPTIGPSPIFDVVASRFASGGLNKARNEPMEKWLAHILMLDPSGYPSAFAFFDGEPDPDKLVPLVDDALNKRLEPIVHVDQKGVFNLHAIKKPVQGN